MAIRVAADVADDGEAVAALKSADCKAGDYKRAAEMISTDRYHFDHRDNRRAARLLAAAAYGGPPVTASSDEEAMFRAVESIEALPVKEAFAMLAVEVPSLRDLEDHVIASCSTPGWADRDADDRVDEILRTLDGLVGPGAPTRSLFIRSEIAHGYARVHLLGTGGLLQEDPEPDPAGMAELLAALGRGYGVKPDVKRVAKAISRRVGDRDGFPTIAVLSLLLPEPGIGARLRRGDGPSDSSRKAMTKILDINAPHLSPAQFADRVVEEVRSTLLRSSGPIRTGQEPDDGPGERL